MRFAILIGCLLVFVTQSAFAGGPDLHAKAVTVNQVIVDDTKMVLILSGPCEMFLIDLSLPQAQGTARMVRSDLKNCVVTIVRHDADAGSGYTNWKDHCDKAKSLEGKQAWFDLQGPITVDNAKIVSMQARASGFGVTEARGGAPQP